MMIIYNEKRHQAQDPNSSHIVHNHERFQVDFGSSGVTEVNIMAKLTMEAEPVQLVDTITVADPSEIYLVNAMPFTWLEFVGGDGSQIAYSTK